MDVLDKGAITSLGGAEQDVTMQRGMALNLHLRNTLFGEFCI